MTNDRVSILTKPPDCMGKNRKVVLTYASLGNKWVSQNDRVSILSKPPDCMGKNRKVVMTYASLGNKWVSQNDLVSILSKPPDCMSKNRKVVLTYASFAWDLGLHFVQMVRMHFAVLFQGCDVTGFPSNISKRGCIVILLSCSSLSYLAYISCILHDSTLHQGSQSSFFSLFVLRSN